MHNEHLTCMLYGDTSETSSVPSSQSYDLSDSFFLALDNSFKRDKTFDPFEIVGQYLADTFILVDVEEDKPLLGSPIILRFEDFDVAVAQKQNAGFVIYKGSLTCETPFKSKDLVLTSDMEAAIKLWSLSWLRANKLHHFVGREVTNVELEAFRSINLEFEEGSRLRIDTDV